MKTVVIMLMMTNQKILLTLLLPFLLTSNECFAQVQQAQTVSHSQASNSFTNSNYNIDWSELKLTDDQMKKIKDLDAQWKGIEQMLRPKIIRDQQQLRNIMSNPKADDNLIRKLQRDIILRQEQLRFEATENFLSKRRILTPEQKEKLHRMMPK